MKAGRDALPGTVARRVERIFDAEVARLWPEGWQRIVPPLRQDQRDRQSAMAGLAGEIEGRSTNQELLVLAGRFEPPPNPRQEPMPAS